MKKIIIAIDGYSSCGKSTLAKALAARLHYAYIDSGAMYRAVTLYFLRHQISLEDNHQVLQALDSIHIHFERHPTGNRTFLNGEDVEEQIRAMDVSEWVSPVAAISAVRKALVLLQQAMGQRKGIVMDGRDIGTVVFPHAELKLFITAETEERVRRRYLELTAKGIAISVDAVRNNLIERDHIDSTRADSPLRQADDAIIIDNTHLTPEAQLEKAQALALPLIGNTSWVK